MSKLKEKQFWPQWHVEINDKGKINFLDKDGWEQFKLPFLGKPMVIVLKKPVKQRSRQEEKYYYGVVIPMVAEEMGISREAAHDFLAGLFLKVEEVSPQGFRYKRVLSTTELGDARYDEYVFKEVVPWASLPTEMEGLNQQSGLGLVIPLPHEVWYDEVV